MSVWDKRVLTGVLAFSVGFGSCPVLAADAEEPVPLLRAVCTEGYPGTDVTMTLECENNPGLRSLGLTVQLPDILTPDIAGENAVIFQKGAAIGQANAYSVYNAETNMLSLTFASPEDGAAESEIAVFTLHVAEDADPETSYPVTVIPDMLIGNTVTDIEAAAEETFFTPVAWPEYTLSDSAITVNENGSPYQLKLSPEPPAGAVKWSSDHFDIAAVMPSGQVYGLKCGTAVITAACGPYSYTCTVTVQKALELNITDYAAKSKGEEFLLTVQDAEAAQPVFASSNPKIASVTEDGHVTVLAKGETDITVTADGKTAVCHVTFQPYLRGDADLNGAVSSADAQAVLLEYLETVVLDAPSVLRAQQRLAGDADLDGSITLRDAMLILRYYAETLTGAETDWDELLKENEN